MSSNYYETVVIINGSLEEDQITQAVDRVSEVIKKNGGEIKEADHWGRKRLAYPINKKNSGYYVQFSFEAPGEIVTPLQRHCQIDEAVLRELTLTLSERDRKRRKETAEKLAIAEQEQAEAEAAEAKKKEEGKA